ncbi:MAG: polysaccharide biosynthesis C-terminal domain-containing protein [Gemmatimonadetes bacterium]|nr:polysaccharide biosynthesis C-terminal domain-containing protein [Gemmatimonadota bacterium]
MTEDLPFRPRLEDMRSPDPSNRARAADDQSAAPPPQVNPPAPEGGPEAIVPPAGIGGSLDGAPQSVAAQAAPSLLRMAGPLVVSFWMRAAFTLVDTAYAATIGDAAIAAIGLTIPFEFLMIAVWVGLSTGLTSCLSRSMGAREGRRIQQYLAAAWQMVVASSVLFALIGVGIWFGAGRFGLEPDVARSFQVFGSVLVAGSAFTTFWSVIPDSLVKAHQDTRSTMWAGIWSNVLNLALNTLFLFVFHWGVFGIALSTVLGRIGGLVYALLRARSHETRRRETEPAHDPGSLDPRPRRAIMDLALPSSLTFALMATETALINVLLATLPRPTEAIAAYSIYYRVTLFALNPILAAGVAMLPYAARRFGEGDVEGVRRGLREASLAAIVYSLGVVAPLLLLGGGWLADQLSESTLTTRYTTVALRLVPLMCLAGAPFLLCRPVFEGMRRGGPGLAVAALRYVVLTGPLAWVGMKAALFLGEPHLYGLLAGLLVAAGLSSAAFHVWLVSSLPARSGGALASPIGG